MVFKKKKKPEEVVPQELPPISTPIIEAGTEDKKPEIKVDPETKARIEALMTEFSSNYNGLVRSDSLTEKALELNLMFAMYGEMVRQRKIMEQMLAED